MAHISPNIESGPSSPLLLTQLADYYTTGLELPHHSRQERTSKETIVLITGTTGNFGCSILENLLLDRNVSFVYALNRRRSNAEENQRSIFISRGFDDDLLSPSRYRMVEGDFDTPGFGLDSEVLDEVGDFY